MTEDELSSRLQAAWDWSAQPNEAQLEEIRGIVRQAEAAGHTDVLIDARRKLLECRIATGLWGRDDDYRAGAWLDLRTLFLRYHALCAREPERFGEPHLDTLWRAFTLAGLSLIQDLDVEVGQVRAILADMASRCRPAHADQYIVTNQRVILETGIGNLAAAAAELRRLRTLDIPRYLKAGNCILSQAEQLAQLGQDAEALAALRPLLTGRLPVTDGDGNQLDTRSQQVGLLLLYLRTGHLAEARTTHQRTWRSNEYKYAIAIHLEFCARSGNEERGLDVLTQPDLLAPGLDVSPMECAWLAAAIALLCRRMVQLGRGAETIALFMPDDDGGPPAANRFTTARTHSGEWTFQQLHTCFAAEARRLARHLDRRFGTTHQSERIHALIHAEPIVDHLPLSPAAGEH